MSWFTQIIENPSLSNMLINALVVVTGAIVAIVSFALLIPLNDVTTITGVTIILAVSYALSVIAWVTIMYYYSQPGRSENLVWLLTHVVFLVMFPATIAATAMNVTAVQNTRNFLAGKIST
jgi:hypothetical protein